MWAVGERSVNKRHEMIEVAKGCVDDLTLQAGIGLVETAEEPTAGIEVGGNLWCRVQGRGRFQPFAQAPFEVLDYRDLTQILARRKLERTPYLLQPLDKLIALKGHARLYGRSPQRPLRTC
jgi:hypothetical protein